jgi:hypothetical protein
VSNFFPRAAPPRSLYAQHTAALHNRKSLVSLSARPTDRPAQCVHIPRVLRDVANFRWPCSQNESCGHCSHRFALLGSCCGGECVKRRPTLNELGQQWSCWEHACACRCGCSCHVLRVACDRSNDDDDDDDDKCGPQQPLCPRLIEPAGTDALRWQRVPGDPPDTRVRRRCARCILREHSVSAAHRLSCSPALHALRAFFSSSLSC